MKKLSKSEHSLLRERSGDNSWAADSIAANIAEGYGRYFYKDRKQFCYYSRGSLMETKTWAKKTFDRELISKDSFDQLIEKLKILHFKLNVYIKKLKQNVQSPNI